MIFSSYLKKISTIVQITGGVIHTRAMSLSTTEIPTSTSNSPGTCLLFDRDVMKYKSKLNILIPYLLNYLDKISTMPRTKCSVANARIMSTAATVIPTSARNSPGTCFVYDRDVMKYKSKVSILIPSYFCYFYGFD